MAWRSGKSDYAVRRVDTDESVSDQFLTLAQTAAKELKESRSPVSYDPDWQLRDHEFFELRGDDIPAVGLFDDLKEFLNLERLTRRVLSKPRLYVVVVQTPDGNAYFGKRMAYLKVLGRERSNFAAVWDGDTFNKLDKSVATFAKTFDWIRWKNRLYVLDASAFHAEFRDGKAIKAAVAAHVAEIQKAIAIKGAENLVERCQASVAMASKLQRVADAGIYGRPIKELKEYAKTHKIPVVWDKDALVFDGSIDAQWSILKLLDEDRTDGPVSGRVYESSSKRTI